MACSVVAKELLVKEVGETLIFTMDFTDRIGSGVTISSATADSHTTGGDTSDLDISNIQISGKKVLMLISGGTDAVQYLVEVTANLSNSEILIGAGMLRVLEA